MGIRNCETRPLSWKLDLSSKINAVSESAELLYRKMERSMDNVGRINGDPGDLKALLYPLRSEVTAAEVAFSLYQLQVAGLVVWYLKNGQAACQLTWHWDHSKLVGNMRFESDFPDPDLPAVNLCMNTFTPVLTRSNQFKRVRTGNTGYTGENKENVFAPVLTRSLKGIGRGREGKGKGGAKSPPPSLTFLFVTTDNYVCQLGHPWTAERLADFCFRRRGDDGRRKLVSEFEGIEEDNIWLAAVKDLFDVTPKEIRREIIRCKEYVLRDGDSYRDLRRYLTEVWFKKAFRGRGKGEGSDTRER